LIDLFNNKGSADMLLIAHAVVENKMIPPTLPFVDDRFVVQHIIVTHDRGIIDLARKIGIETMNQEVFLKNM
jgi:hypothetical protein